MATPYRDDESALRQRLAALDAQLRDARSLPEKRRELDEARSRLEAERAAVAERLAAAGDGFSLEGLRVASPCKADWGAMVGDERVRFCGQCQKNVYNLSGMARDEAQALVRGAEGKLCIRMFKRADGTVLTSDCPDGVRRKQRRRLAVVVAGAGALGASAFGYASTQATMGEFMPAPTTTVGQAAAEGGSLEVPTQLDRGRDEPREVVGEWAGEPPPKADEAPKKHVVLMGAPVPLPPAKAGAARKGH